MSRDREALEQAVVRGSDLLKQGKTELAQRAFRAALEVEPDNARVLALLGLTHFRANELAEARPIYEQLVERAPTDASHRLNLGLVYLKLNDADKAIGALEASRAIDPSQGRAVSYLGLAYARAGRYPEAYRAFLVAGQNELAIEIEGNLTAVERDRIHAQIGRSPTTGRAAPHASDDMQATQRMPVTTAHATVPMPLAMQTQLMPPLHFPPPGASDLPAAGPDTTPDPARAPPRTKPPSAPPAKSRTASQEYRAMSAELDAALDLAAGVPEAVAIAPLSPAVLRANADEREPMRFTESMQFVLPRAEPAAPPMSPDGASMISRAVASATPLVATAMPTRSGGVSPRPLSELATDDLIRPDEGDDAFEVGGNGALIIRITERVMTRLDGVHITGGDLAFEPAMRRSRGHNTDEAFDHGGSQLHAVTGHGYLIAVPGKHAFSAVVLDDDILYLREDLVFAFQASLRWENGNVPGLRGKLPVVQFRGDGALALRLIRPLVRVKLPALGVVLIDAERLAGWIGRVIPRAVVPPPGGPLGAMCVECTGEGIVLVEPALDVGLAAAVAPTPRPPTDEPVAPSPDAAATTGSDEFSLDLTSELGGDLTDRLDEL